MAEVLPTDQPVSLSGVSLGASEPVTNHIGATETAPNRGILGSIGVIEVQLVAFIMVFSASGLVPLIDMVFPAFASAYFIVLSRLVFPAVGRSGEAHILKGGKLLRLYTLFGTTFGLFLPLAYILGGFARADDHAVRSATPHLFLLSFQILTEKLMGGMLSFSAPVRALAPLLYTVRRIFVLFDWTRDVWVNNNLLDNAQIQDVVWHWFGRSLATANLAYFAVNLFCFLIPRCLPKAFEFYFKGQKEDETCAKLAEDTPILQKEEAYKKAD